MPKRNPKPQKTILRDPLDGIPEIAPNVETRVQDDGGLLLRRELQPAGRVERFLRGIFKQKYFRKFALDSKGAYFWSQIDGELPLRRIVGNVREYFDFSEEQAVNATLTYTRELMLRGLIIIKVKKDTQTAGGRL